MALLAGAIWLPAQLSADPPLQKVSLLLDWYPQAEQGGYYYALINGLYKKAGLDVTIVPAAPGVAMGGQVAIGRMQFMLTTAADVLMARGRGLPLVGIMATMEHDPKGIIVHDNSPIHSFADLNDQLVAIGPGSAWFLYVVKKYHLDHIHETRLTLNNAFFLHNPDYSQECFVTAEPYFIEKAGVKVRTILVTDTGFDNYRCIATSDGYLAAHKDAVKGFVEASIAGWIGYMKDPVATNIEIKKRNPEMTQGQMDYTDKVMADDRFISGDPTKGEATGQINMNRIKVLYDILRSLNVIPADYDYTKSFDNEFCAPAPAPAPAPAHA
jgi:NitT/TauT family transport system substrate-binding protein